MTRWMNSIIAISLLLSACTAQAAPTGTPTQPPATDIPLPPSTPEATLAPLPAPINQYAGYIGAEASFDFIDAMKNTRPWQAMDGSAAPTDEDGWPTTDAFTVVFDERPCCVFFEPPLNTIDDPEAFQHDIHGVYHLSFTGQADIAPYEDASAFTVQNQQYDAASNTTTAEIAQHSGKQLMVIAFTNTNGGVRHVQLIRPGYDPAGYDPARPFTPETYRLHQPFAVLRFMVAVSTNDNGGINDFGAIDNRIEWSERHLPTDATQQNYGKKYGIAWEYVIQLANELNKDVWINVPAAASEDYIRELARLFKDGNEFTEGLKPGLKIYLEDSNEVWNGGFPQQPYNLSAAKTEVMRDANSPLNQPAAFAEDVWAIRRHARRVMEIGTIFGEVYGEGSVPGLIRPVFSWWVLQASHYEWALEWLAQTYGPPSGYLYGIASAGYFSMGNNSTGEIPVNGLIANLCSSSDITASSTKTYATLAAQYGLKFLAYEGGPDSSYEFTKTNIANRALAMRDPRLADVIYRHFTQNWFPNGGELFIYFMALGRNTRFGYFGATEDFSSVWTPQFKALYALGLLPPEEGGGGLYGKFYRSAEFSGPVIASRIENIAFDWGEFSPAWEGLLPPDGFSARWEGLLQAPVSGDYTFSLQVTGKVRLILDGEITLEQWDSPAAGLLTSRAIPLESGQTYAVQIEFADTPGLAELFLSWEYPGQAQQIIPRAALIPVADFGYSYTASTCEK